MLHLNCGDLTVWFRLFVCFFVVVILKKGKRWKNDLHMSLGVLVLISVISGLLDYVECWRQQDILNVFLQWNSKGKIIFLLSQCFHIPKSRLCRKNGFSIFSPLECTEVNVLQNTWYLILKMLFIIRETLQSCKIGFLSHHLLRLY